MKKLLLSICTILALGLVSCGGGESSSSDNYYYEDNNSGGSNINFTGRQKTRGGCKNNIYLDHKTCNKFVEHPHDARFCATCGCPEIDHWYE